MIYALLATYKGTNEIHKNAIKYVCHVAAKFYPKYITPKHLKLAPK